MAIKRIYGLVAEFESPDQLLSAAHRTREAGYRRIDAFSPMPVEGLAEAVGFHTTRLPLVVLLAGMFGAAAGFFLQWYANVLSFPLNERARWLIRSILFLCLAIVLIIFLHAVDPHPTLDEHPAYFGG